MLPHYKRRGSAGILVAAFAAMTAVPARADCKAFPFSAWQPFVERVVINSSSLLSEFPDGGGGLTQRVALIGSSSKAGTQSVISTARLATPHQKDAIARGLVAAARLCEKDYPVEARNIELAVAKSKDATFRRQFRDAFQSELEREAIVRAGQLGESMQNDARSNPASHRRLFDPFRSGAVPAVGVITPVPGIR